MSHDQDDRPGGTQTGAQTGAQNGAQPGNGAASGLHNPRLSGASRDGTAPTRTQPPRSPAAGVAGAAPTTGPAPRRQSSPTAAPDAPRRSAGDLGRRLARGLRRWGELAWALLRGDPGADRVVPPTGVTARLTQLTAGAMAVLAVFALAVAVSTDRMADRWSEELARTATLRISAPEGQVDAQVAAALTLLGETPGVAGARRLTPEEERALLEPWFGPDLPVETLPIPALIEITTTEDGIDAGGLRARLAGEVPGAIYDDHTRWRTPLVGAATRVRTLGLLALVLIGTATAAMVVLAANAALAANARVIAALRLVGARDVYIARAFVRRFTRRALFGAGIGTAAGMALIALLPAADAATGVLGGLGFAGAGWLWPLVVPPLAALTAFWATRFAALRRLKELT